jgi:hypothetical protein
MGWPSDVWNELVFSLTTGRKWRANERARNATLNATAQIYELPPSTPPEATPFRYEWHIECGVCHAQNAIFVDKYVANLESLRDEILTQCANCGSADRDSSGIGFEDMDADVLAFWMADEDSYFLSEDEELILAMVPDTILIESIEACIASDNWKLHPLIEGLMVSFTNSECATEDESEAKQWLRENPERWDRSSMLDYLRERVHAKLKLG